MLSNCWYITILATLSESVHTAAKMNTHTHTHTHTHTLHYSTAFRLKTYVITQCLVPSLVFFAPYHFNLSAPAILAFFPFLSQKQLLFRPFYMQSLKTFSAQCTHPMHQLRINETTHFRSQSKFHLLREVLPTVKRWKSAHLVGPCDKGKIPVSRKLKKAKHLVSFEMIWTESSSSW
jgi:hypothetical protein